LISTAMVVALGRARSLPISLHAISSTDIRDTGVDRLDDAVVILDVEFRPGFDQLNVWA
jgi:hypothetical protein